MKRNVAAALAVALIVAASFATAAEPAADARGKFDDHLEAYLQGLAGPTAVRVLVTTVGTPSPAADAARALGAEVVWTYAIIDGFAAVVPAHALEPLASRPDVAGVFLDRPVTTVMDVSHRAIEADKVWATGNRGAGVTVAVIDTGIDMFHTFFAGAVVSCVSTVGGLVTPECQDSDGHGTHVAGTVASRDATYPGIAPEANLAVVRVLHAAGSGTSSDIIAGMDWVRANRNSVSPPIRVATMSIGYLSPGCGDDNNPEAQAANALVASGVFFSVAAGNSGHNGCTIDGASAASRVLSVAAVDDRGTVAQGDDFIADFSSGGSSKNGKPDVAFPGVGITSAFIGLGTLIATMDGTSMATPHAAGTAALLFADDPGRTADQVKNAITGTAVKTANTGSSFNYVYGHGLGNACRALGLSTCATTAPPPPPVEAHVSSVAMAFSHGGGKNPPHRVSATVNVVDASNAAVSGADVTVRFTSPESNTYTTSGTTSGGGSVTMEVTQRGGGHGTWQACVTNVVGTNLVYDSARNTETCETIVVT